MMSSDAELKQKVAISRSLAKRSRMQFRPLLKKIHKGREIYHRYYCDFILQDKPNL